MKVVGFAGGSRINDLRLRDVRVRGKIGGRDLGAAFQFLFWGCGIIVRAGRTIGRRAYGRDAVGKSVWASTG